MRSVHACGVFLCVTLGVLQPALAQETCPNPKALAVARTVEIDTAQGPQFGAQYKDPKLLADGEVVLTFDDGPSRAYTKPILEALAAHCTKAIFFMVGRMAASDPEMVKEVARQGHTVATHTWSHPNLQSLTPLRARAEIEMGFSAVQEALGSSISPFFRFPYLRDTASTLSYLQGRQMAAFSIDVDSKDYMTKDAGTVYERVMGHLAANRRGIILFHDIHASTARALPRLLAELKTRGYRVVHLRPKAQASTLADFDAVARQEIERKRLAATGQPLAKRALTWPSTTNSVAPEVPTPAKAPATEPRASHRSQARDDWKTNMWPQ